jgi:hypothetical protein
MNFNEENSFGNHDQLLSYLGVWDIKPFIDCESQENSFSFQKDFNKEYNDIMNFPGSSKNELGNIIDIANTFQDRNNK